MHTPTGCGPFDRDFQKVSSLCSHPISNSDEALATLKQIQLVLCSADMSRYDLDILRRHSPRLLTAFYDLRLGLRSRIADWHAQGIVNRQVEDALRGAFRALRYATDMVGEHMIRYRRPGREFSRTLAFASETYGTIFHPTLREATSVEFRSGDVVLFRGTLHNSAAIARIGDSDSQFSHAAIVYIDPEDGRQYLVEALIEDGAVISSLPRALRHNVARAVVFRHRDPKVAQGAADYIHGRVSQSRRLFGRPIPYDFTMELEGYDRLFCSKLLRQAFVEGAGANPGTLPAFPTRFENASRDFMDRIGVTAKQSFAPGDMELEYSFHAIAEWRDFERTSDIRLQDFVMDKLFEWMEKDGYKFRENVGILVMSSLGKAGSYLPDPVKSLFGVVVPKIPANMTRSTIAAIAMLHYTAEPLYEELKKLERKMILERGYPLHPREILAHLDEIRARSPRRIGNLHPPARTA